MSTCDRLQVAMCHTGGFMYCILSRCIWTMAYSSAHVWVCVLLLMGHMSATIGPQITRIHSVIRCYRKFTVQCEIWAQDMGEQQQRTKRKKKNVVTGDSQTTKNNFQLKSFDINLMLSTVCGPFGAYYTLICSTLHPRVCPLHCRPSICPFTISSFVLFVVEAVDVVVVLFAYRGTRLRGGMD